MKPCGATRSLKGFEEDERGFIKSTKANDTLFELAEETC